MITNCYAMAENTFAMTTTDPGGFEVSFHGYEGSNSHCGKKSFGLSSCKCREAYRQYPR